MTRGEDVVYSGQRRHGAIGGGRVGEYSGRPETPLMHEIHYLERKYGTVTKAPENDEHLIAARRLVGAEDRMVIDNDQVWAMYLSGLTVKEIAARLRVSRSNIDNRIFRMKREQIWEARHAND